MSNKVTLSDKKRKVFALQSEDSGTTSLIHESMESLLEAIQIEIEEAPAGEEFDFKIKVVELSEKEIEELPEYDG